MGGVKIRRRIFNREVEEVKKVKEEELKYFISYTSSTFSTLW
jgi:hypothetical protein